MLPSFTVECTLHATATVLCWTIKQLSVGNLWSQWIPDHYLGRDRFRPTVWQKGQLSDSFIPTFRQYGWLSDSFRHAVWSDMVVLCLTVLYPQSDNMGDGVSVLDLHSNSMVDCMTCLDLVISVTGWLTFWQLKIYIMVVRFTLWQLYIYILTAWSTMW